MILLQNSSLLFENIFKSTARLCLHFIGPPCTMYNSYTADISVKNINLKNSSVIARNTLLQIIKKTPADTSREHYFLL